MLKGKKIGFALTGSFCTFAQIIPVISDLVEREADVIPIASREVYETDTRFGLAKDWIAKVENTCNRRVIATIVDAEPIGPKRLLDAVVVAPCTGNTLAKLASAITDGPVLMACKAHLRNLRPVIVAISTNDGLSLNAKNIGILLAAKNIFFVPFGQDNPETKANSLVARMELVPETIEHALVGKQIQPVLIERFRY